MNVAADGNIFELAENSKYVGSSAEHGKDTPTHRNIETWDYFIKSVEIDGIRFDMLINIRKNKQKQFVYNIGLNKSKYQGQTAQQKPNDFVIQAQPNPDTDSISQNNNSVNTQYMQNGQDNAQKNSVKGVDNILREDIEKIQSIPKKSVNDFTSDDIKKTEKFARKYFKEMGTKSPFFRAWFGDWRANDDTRVKVADKKGAERGVTRNADTGWDINVSGKVFNETKSHNQNYNVKARPYLEYINSIVENAVLLDSYTIPNTKKKSNNSAMMHSFYAIADIGNGRELVKLYVEELNDVNSDGTIKRAYQLQNIENQQLNDRVQGNTLAPSASTANIHTVSQLFNLVKTFDKNLNRVQNIIKQPLNVRSSDNNRSSIISAADSYIVSQLYDIVKRFDKNEQTLNEHYSILPMRKHTKRRLVQLINTLRKLLVRRLIPNMKQM